MSEIEVVEGKKVKILFDGKKCIHSRGCVLSRPDVFVPNVEGEWIHPDAATPEEIAELAHNCPSGAINYQMKDGMGSEKPPLVNLLRIRENGPYALHGALKIEGEEPAFRATLCRCGHSKNKPYCDGAHAIEKFEATGEVLPVEFSALSERGGDVSIKPKKNGPLIVSGSLEIVTGTGKTVNKVEKTFLCRCGHSANKPYCDGTHSKVNFTS
jgi:CDGSH-type Zn-finger protein/uncharacterized Fe-S cluster protein YjdI